MAINSPVNLKSFVKGLNSASANCDQALMSDQLMVTSILTKSLAVPNNKQVEQQNAASSKTREGLFKILKEFEEQLETGF